jgi:hypothetical protein
MRWQIAAIGAALSLLAAGAGAQKAPKPAPSPDTFVCRDIPRFESRIKDRVCGSPRDVARYVRDRDDWIRVSGEPPRSGNGIANPNTAE